MTAGAAQPPAAAQLAAQPNRACAWSTARPWITNALLLLLGIALIAFARQLVREYDQFQIGFSGVSSWSAVLYIAAGLVVLTQPVNRWTIWIILAVAVACRLATLFAEPFLSTDVYRYAWDGVVQHAGISPYRYVPGDPALTFLREPNQDLFDHINRRDYARTIYPPVAQMIFYAITWISPTVTFMKTAMVLFEGLTAWALLRLLAALGRRPEQILLYAWCPLLVWEVAEAGHLDSAGMAFIALALVARLRRQPILTGLWLGVAVMIKFYPLVLLPALWQRGDTRGSAWKMPATVAAVIAVGYACYARVGLLVFGFAGGYAQEEGLETGARYFLFDLARRIRGLHFLPLWSFFAVCALVFGALTLWAWRNAADQPTAADQAHITRTHFLSIAFAFAFALMLLFSPHYPWYVLWLIPFFTLLPNLPVLVYLMGIFYGFTTVYALPGPKLFLLDEWLYGLTALAALVWLAARPRSFANSPIRNKRGHTPA